MGAKRPADDDYFLCPHCGERLAAGAKFCRHCGADAEMGWGPEGLDGDPTGGYEDDDFDYDEFIAREFPTRPSHRPAACFAGSSGRWWCWPFVPR